LAFFLTKIIARKVNEAMRNRTNWSFWIFVAIVTFVYFFDHRDDFIEGAIEGANGGGNEKWLNQDVYVSFVLVFLWLLFAVTLFLIIRNRQNKKRFNNIFIQAIEEEKNKDAKDKPHFFEETETGSFHSDIDNSIVESILLKLEEFEKSMRYTNSDYTSVMLAKELKTNSSYLSKTINDYKKQNIPSYLKELRVNLAINRLKNESKFRTYTIQAIAEEVGFKTAQSFSTAFYKKTGIKPSYFIKQLAKNE
jgi:AraC-like DNA-binding protein